MLRAPSPGSLGSYDLKPLLNVAGAVAVAFVLGPLLLPFWSDVVAQAPPAPAEGYQLTFVCPTGSERAPPSTEIIRVGCPFRILDDEDALGSPTVLVNPWNPAEVAFTSLHGGGEVPGPTPRSRGGGKSGVFTVFTSSDGGYNWADQPSQSVYPLEPATERYGEHVTAAMDTEGHLYGAGVFSMNESAETAWTSRMLLWKWNTAAHTVQWPGAEEVEPLAVPSTITWASVTFLPRADSMLYENPPYDKPDNFPWANNTTTPSPSPTASSAPKPPPSETMVVTWLETAADPARPLEGKASRLRAAWVSTAHERAPWEFLPIEQTVGPCSSISNGVAWHGGVYVACVVADGKAYNHRRLPNTGEIDVWRVVPEHKRMELVAQTPLTGGNPRMTTSSDGRFALATAQRLDAANVRVDVSFAWFGRTWSGVSEIGDAVQTGRGAIIDARIHAMAYLKGSRVLHLIYGEVYPPVGIDVTAPGPPRTAQFSKSIVAMNECDGLVAPPFDLNVGVVHQYSPVRESGLDFTNFDDLVDGLIVVPDPGRAQREFISYADMGIVNYAELKQSSAPICALVGPGGNPADLGGQPNPVLQPAPSPALTPAAIAAGTGAGVLGLALLARIVAAGRRSKVEAPAGIKK